MNCYLERSNCNLPFSRRLIQIARTSVGAQAALSSLRWCVVFEVGGEAGVAMDE